MTLFSILTACLTLWLGLVIAVPHHALFDHPTNLTLQLQKKLDKRHSFQPTSEEDRRARRAGYTTAGGSCLTLGGVEDLVREAPTIPNRLFADHRRPTLNFATTEIQIHRLPTHDLSVCYGIVRANAWEEPDLMYHSGIEMKSGDDRWRSVQPHSESSPAPLTREVPIQMAMGKLSFLSALKIMEDAHHGWIWSWAQLKVIRTGSTPAIRDLPDSWAWVFYSFVQHAPPAQPKKVYVFCQGPHHRVITENARPMPH